MPGVKEGWPKIIAEAWAHGTIPVASRGGIVPWILGADGSGFIIEPTPAALAGALAQLLSDPSHMSAVSKNLHVHAKEISLDQFKARLERVLVERCGLS
jgi:glycosyltransferase involved in cell wall biosynthesis